VKPIRLRACMTILPPFTIIPVFAAYLRRDLPAGVPGFRRGAGREQGFCRRTFRFRASPVPIILSAPAGTLLNMEDTARLCRDGAVILLPTAPARAAPAPPPRAALSPAADAVGGVQLFQRLAAEPPVRS